MKRFLLAFLNLYRDWLSPVIHVLSPTGCRFRPTCSEYASEAIAMHGARRGSWLALRRLLRCHPFGRGGFDPVPLPAEAGVRSTQTAHSLAGSAPKATARALHDPLP